MPRSRLGHVITPLGLVEVHLLLCIGEHGQVGQGPLLAKVGGHRQPPFRATCTVHPQFPSLGTLGHPRLAPLGCHANSFALSALLPNSNPDLIICLNLLSVIDFLLKWNQPNDVCTEEQCCPISFKVCQYRIFTYIYIYIYIYISVSIHYDCTNIIWKS
uniref:Uncharacterized protein n=1 Tax=Oncorhynchus mykiss TaxID=8022 RepID=A0A8K9UZB9_ONCMY